LTPDTANARLYTTKGVLMSKYRKVIEKRMYTEVVIYDEDDVEVARERQYDDHLWDLETVDVTPEDIEDYDLEDE
jgi:hypothetical protein